jgi:hypothetical protein
MRSESASTPATDRSLERVSIARAELLQRLQVTCDRRRRAEIEQALAALEAAGIAPDSDGEAG